MKRHPGSYSEQSPGLSFSKQPMGFGSPVPSASTTNPSSCDGAKDGQTLERAVIGQVVGLLLRLRVVRLVALLFMDVTSRPVPGDRLKATGKI